MVSQRISSTDSKAAGRRRWSKVKHAKSKKPERGKTRRSMNTFNRPSMLKRWLGPPTTTLTKWDTAHRIWTRTRHRATSRRMLWPRPQDSCSHNTSEATTWTLMAILEIKCQTQFNQACRSHLNECHRIHVICSRIQWARRILATRPNWCHRRASHLKLR